MKDINQLESKKIITKKDMKHGNSFKYLIIFLFCLINFSSFAENEITSTPLINLDELKPSFEETEMEDEKIINEKIIKKKNKSNSLNKFSAVLIGLDKITAKSSKIIVNIDETKKFGPLELSLIHI